MPRSQRLVALTVVSFAGTAICLGWIVFAVATLAKGKPTPASSGIVAAFAAFALARAVLLGLAGVACVRRDRRARLLAGAWAVLAIVDAVVALFVLGAPPIAASAGLVVPVATLAVLAAAPPPELRRIPA